MLRFLLILGEKYHADAIILAQVDIKTLFGQCPQESIRFLHQQTAAITGDTISSNTATMGHTGQ